MLSLRVIDSINAIPLTEWNAIAESHPYTYSHEYLEILESSGCGNSHYQYVVINDDVDCLVAVTPLKIYRADIAVFASGWLRKWLFNIRMAFPNFLKVQIVECAPPIGLPAPHEHDESDPSQLINQILSKALSGIAKDQGALISVIGPFEPRDQQIQPVIESLGFRITPCLPVAHLDIAWKTPDAYLSSLKSYYRSKLRRHLRINQSNGIHHELRDDFHDLADVLWRQWLVVNQNAKECDDETLNADFYREFSLKFGARSKALLIYSNNELVGHALILLDGDTLRWRNFGRTNPHNDSLYIYACYIVVETAILLGAKRLDLGVTTYSIKRDFGSSIVPRTIAIRSSFGLIDSALVRLFALLNHVPGIQEKDVFKAVQQWPSQGRHGLGL
jgi:predicted N-acyltransferase